MGIAYNTKIVRDNLVLQLDAANVKSYPGSGTTVYDLSGNELDFTLVNGASVTQGVFVLDGANDYVARGYSFDWTSIPWTVSFFAKATDFAYPTVIDLIAAGNGHFRFDLTLSSIRSMFRTPGGSGSTLVNYNTSINLDQWYHCAFTRQEDTFKAYLNGKLGATNTNVNFTNSSGMTSIRIGYSADYDASDRTFEGSVGPVSIYAEELTADEIKINFEAMRGRYNI